MSNLLPPEQKKSLLHLYRMRFFAVVFIAIICVAAIGIAALIPSFFVSKESEATLTASRDVLASHETSSIQKSLSQSIIDINDRLSVFSGSWFTSPILADFVDPILSAKPAGLRLTDLSFTPDKSGMTAKVEISGVANNRELLLAFGDKVKQLPNFSNVDIPITSFIKDSNVTFTITGTLTIH